MEARYLKLLHALDRLGNIARHDALVLLRYSLSSSNFYTSCVAPRALATRVSKDSTLSFGRACARFSIYPCRMTHWWAGNSISYLACTSSLLGFCCGYPFTPVQHARRQISVRPTIQCHAGPLHISKKASSVMGSDVSLFHKQSYWDKPLIGKVISDLNKLTDPYH